LRFPATPAIDEAIANAFQEEWGRLVAALIRRTGDWDLAEECAQQAFEQAARRWPISGVPDKPGAWLTTVAGNAAIDRIRRAKRGSELLEQIGRDPTREAAMQDLLAVEPEIEDDRLRLIFTCCHPALLLEARVALTLRAVAGLTTAEIAKAFLVPEPTMGKRITRAKAKIAAAGIPYRVPPAKQLPERLSGVLAVLYLLFNEGYLASSGDELVRRDLTAEAIRLTRILIELMPGEPEIRGLLALMLFNDSRKHARTDASGELVTLEEQDRSVWDHLQIAEATVVLEQALALREVRPGLSGTYVLQAAIAACHATAVTAGQTDWVQIESLYKLLLEFNDTPVIRLNHAVATAFAGDTDAALDALDELEQALADHYLLHATRADLLRREIEHGRSGAFGPAQAAYQRALELVPSESERRFLQRRLAQLQRRSGAGIPVQERKSS
jgi:RNA polymerase sigma-70 factor, ECF subfamily